MGIQLKNGLMERNNDKTNGLEIEQVGIDRKKTITRKHEVKTFVPILCYLLTKTGPIRGHVTIANSFYNIDIVILICCSLSLFTYSERLRI